MIILSEINSKHRFGTFQKIGQNLLEEEHWGSTELNAIATLQDCIKSAFFKE